MAAVSDLRLIASGKVREIYELDDQLLLVASDRISTYDVVHPNPIPGKGAVLTAISTFWFEQTSELVPNHLVSVTDGVPDDVRGRAMVVKKLSMLPVEAIVRGYITGSGWKDYQQTGSVSGVALPAGLRESEQLPEPIFTPSTKADVGHDEAIDFERAAELIGDGDLTERLRDASIAVYQHAAAHARARGIILADTKFEFGLDADGRLTLGDEACTPDSSRFWPADGYEPGQRPAELRQADRARLGILHRLGQAPARPRDPGGGCRAHAREVHRGLRAHHRQRLRRLGRPHPGERPLMRARVLIRPKAGILDPQGQAVERALPALGFSGVSAVHVGRLVELDVDDATQLPSMCERLLANPLVEDYEIIENA